MQLAQSVIELTIAGTPRRLTGADRTLGLPVGPSRDNESSRLTPCIIKSKTGLRCQLSSAAVGSSSAAKMWGWLVVLYAAGLVPGGAPERRSLQRRRPKLAVHSRHGQRLDPWPPRLRGCCQAVPAGVGSQPRSRVNKSATIALVGDISRRRQPALAR
jgi:hypothetical protein